VTIQVDMSAAATESAVRSLLVAIESRGLRAVAAVLAVDCTWQNVPHTPVIGRDAVVALLAPVLCWADRVQWEVLSQSYDDGLAWVERADRFWIDGAEHVVRCNGVITVDVAAGLVTSVRDYVDLDEWRARLAPVLETMASRTPVEVVSRHLRAVGARDQVAMAADYSLEAVLERGGDVYRGWGEIADYFATVPQRLGEGRLTLSSAQAAGTAEATVEWTIDASDGSSVRGHDHYVVQRGRIIYQQVTLLGNDF